ELELLREKELVPEIRLSFVHAMVQQVAYESLLVSARSSLHASAGQALEKLYTGRLDGVLPELARHYGRGDDPDRALRFLVRAGERAASLFAYAEAQGWYGQALEAAARVPDPEGESAAVRIRMGDAAEASGDIRAALGEWRSALATVEAR